MRKLYTTLATWWPLLSPVTDYTEEAAFFMQVLREAALPAAASLLELGSGGGSNAYHLKSHFANMTLTDIAPEMLAISRLFNPGCEHLEGDMRSLRLHRTFDVILIHDAIDYMLTLHDLERALETAAVHCKPRGLALFAPDFLRETFQPSTDHGGTDVASRKLRYLEWNYDPDPNDNTYCMEFVYLLREDTQARQVEHDVHTCGLFARADWLQLLSKVGFEETKVIQDPFARELFLCRKGSA